MSGYAAEALGPLDLATLFVIATCVTSLLGVFLLFAYLQERLVALAWWGCAYLIGGFSSAIWRLGDLVSPPLPASTPDVLLFLAVGMIWSAARLFHGRPVLWSGMLLGAGGWLAASGSPAFVHSATAHVTFSSLIVAVYTFLTAAELWRERRQALIRRWPALFVPMLHGAIFLFPMALANLSMDIAGASGLATGWAALFAVEIVLYVIGAAFVVLVLAKDRTVRQYKAAANTDPLTGVMNRRGFFDAAGALLAARSNGEEPVSVLAFDLDHFKSINDGYGHQMGDAMLRLFAEVARTTMRGGDLIGRIGGEEFVALVPGSLAQAATAAERVRAAFADASLQSGTEHVPATVSVGVACGAPDAALDMLIARADAALYRAKANGRNRIELADEAVSAALSANSPLRLPGERRRLAPGLPGHPVPIPVRAGGRR